MSRKSKRGYSPKKKQRTAYGCNQTTSPLRPLLSSFSKKDVALEDFICHSDKTVEAFEAIDYLSIHSKTSIEYLIYLKLPPLRVDNLILHVLTTHLFSGELFANVWDCRSLFKFSGD